MSEEEQGTRKDYASSLYALTPNRLLATLGPLKGEINCDVCVIGGGFTGLSAALELSKKGYSVTLLEGRAIADSASGKNSGHILRGYTRSPGALAAKYGAARAKTLCNLSLAGLGLIIERIAKYDIKCDLKFGHVTTALNNNQITMLKKSIQDWAKIGHTDLQFLNKNDTISYVRTGKYMGGMVDPKGAHFHPLNYALGVAQAAQAHGCKIYDETPVVSIEKTSPARVMTESGVVTAKFLVLGGNIHFAGMEKINRKVIPATASMLATEPLSEKRAQTMLPKNTAITEASFNMNYFRFSPDRRLLFGGDFNYSGRASPGQGETLRRRMLSIFPELDKVKIEHFWNSPMDITLNRMPHFGRLTPNIFYAHGYCGHNIILGNLAGMLIAEAMSGTAERFDVFAKIGHASFIGGDLIKRPIFSLGMTWNRIQDALF